MGCCTSKTSSGPQDDQSLPATRPIPLQQDVKIPVATALEQTTFDQNEGQIRAPQPSATDAEARRQADVQRQYDPARRTAESRYTPPTATLGPITTKATTPAGDDFEDAAQEPMGVDPDAVKNRRRLAADDIVESAYRQSQNQAPPSIQNAVVPKPIPAKPRTQPTQPLSSWYTNTTPPTKPPVSKFRRARDERGMALIQQEELTRKEREIRARYAGDPAAARIAIDELRRNYASKRDIKEHQLDPETRLRAEGQSKSPLAGPPSAEERRQQPSPDRSPYIDFETLRWD